MIKSNEIYVVYDDGLTSIDEVFLTKEEAQRYCEDLNFSRAKRRIKDVYKVMTLSDAIDEVKYNYNHECELDRCYNEDY